MKNVFIVYWYDEKDGVDFEAVFDGDQFLEAWTPNDAIWRSEYYDGWLEKLGIKIQYREPTETDKIAMKKHFGLE